MGARNGVVAGQAAYLHSLIGHRSGLFGRVEGAACRDGLSAVVLPVRAAGVSESRFSFIATVPSVASQPPIRGLDPSTACGCRKLGRGR